jgi:hypothetical protein
VEDEEDEEDEEEKEIEENEEEEAPAYIRSNSPDIPRAFIRTHVHLRPDVCGALFESRRDNHTLFSSIRIISRDKSLLSGYLSIAFFLSILPLSGPPPLAPRKNTFGSYALLLLSSWAKRTSERANGRTGERANGRTGERANERTGERANERTSERASERATKQPTNQPTNQPTDRPTDRPTDQPTDRPTDRPEINRI